jgi:hypothetical protein
MVKRICLTCKKEFYMRPNTVGKFCSHKCYALSLIKRVKRICKQCGRIFDIQPRRTKIFCNPKCQAKFITKRIKRICKICHKSFEAIPYHIKRGEGKFCSHPCYSKSLIGRPLSEETKKKLTKYRGRLASNWQGGKRIDKDGYITIYQPNHPFATKNNSVLEHRLIIEKAIGHYLNKSEVCHHINGKRDDNRLQNLMVFKSYSAHRLFHLKPHKISPYEIIFDGRN